MNTATLNLSHLIRLTTLLVIAAISVPALAADFFFRDGDVVVMIGDSITEQHLYSNYVEMWTVTRFPNWNLTFRNVGIGGDRSVGGNARFERDVLLHKPTAMTVDFGMNDGSYREFSEATFKPYMEGLQGMANQAKAANLRTAWITPQPLDADEQGPTALTGYNVTLEKFSEGVKTIAGTNAGLFVDQFHPYLFVLDHARHSGPKYERITDGDAVHPGPPGQALMAASILKGLNFPARVASVEIDAVTKKTVSADNCSTENIVAKDGGIRFSKTDHALPFFPEDANSILKWTPILEELNDYRLKITGLPAGNYEVHVDGVKVTELTSEQLDAGANIAAAILKTGPIADQSRAARQAVEQKNRFHLDRIFRGIVFSNVPDWIDEVISRDELESKRQSVIGERLRKLREFDREVKDALVTKSHTFDILPVK